MKEKLMGLVLPSPRDWQLVQHRKIFSQIMLSSEQIELRNDVDQRLKVNFPLQTPFKSDMFHKCRLFHHQIAKSMVPSPVITIIDHLSSLPQIFFYPRISSLYDYSIDSQSSCPRKKFFLLVHIWLVNEITVIKATAIG